MRSATQLNSGKNVPELSKSFDIAKNILFRWKTNQNMKKQTKISEQQSTYLLQTIAENEKLRKDVARLQDERDILKKASAGLPLAIKAPINLKCYFIKMPVESKLIIKSSRKM